MLAFAVVHSLGRTERDIVKPDGSARIPGPESQPAADDSRALFGNELHAAACPTIGPGKRLRSSPDTLPEQADIAAPAACDTGGAHHSRKFVEFAGNQPRNGLRYHGIGRIITLGTGDTYTCRAIEAALRLISEYGTVGLPCVRLFPDSGSSRKIHFLLESGIRNLHDEPLGLLGLAGCFGLFRIFRFGDDRPAVVPAGQ